MKKTSILTLTIFYSVIFARLVDVSTSEELILATKGAQAGDTILVSSGEYVGDMETSGDPGNLPNGTGYFWIGANGTADNPIVVMGKDTVNPPVLKGDSISTGYIFHVTGDYVVLKNLNITFGDKGVVFDNSSYSILEDCEVHNTGSELVHVRDSSCNVIINRNLIYNSGNGGGGTYGEGLYIGTDRARWGADDVDSSLWGDKAREEGYGGYDWRVHNTQVMYNYFKGSISAECMDVKEGTQYTHIEGNMFVGDSIGKKEGAKYYDDSFIDQKGVKGTYINNKFDTTNTTLTRYIVEVDRSGDATNVVPPELTADGYSNPWCDEGDNDSNVCWEADNELISAPIDTRLNSPKEYFKFFDPTTNLTTSIKKQNSNIAIHSLRDGTLQLSSPQLYSEISLVLYTLRGQKVAVFWNGDIAQGEQNVSLQNRNLAPGNYLLEIKGKEIHSFTQIQAN
jgi:hypothetical protein